MDRNIEERNRFKCILRQKYNGEITKCVNVHIDRETEERNGCKWT